MLDEFISDFYELPLSLLKPQGSVSLSVKRRSRKAAPQPCRRKWGEGTVTMPRGGAASAGSPAAAGDMDTIPAAQTGQHSPL